MLLLLLVQVSAAAPPLVLLALLLDVSDEESGTILRMMGCALITAVLSWLMMPSSLATCTDNVTQ